MEALLGLILLFFQAILAMVAAIIAVGLFWKMQAIGRPFMANVWWLLNFLPLAYAALVAVFGQSVEVLERVLILGLFAGYFSIRFFNPLNRARDGFAPDDAADGQDGITG
ncbi:MAG: hypothetical protein VYD64_09415 [Pseudomonadota bacterium]|nr:hypothetical protein [Pseudomonadota bacterium]